MTTQEQIAMETGRKMLNDLSRKLHDDVMKAMMPTVGLAAGELGAYGVYALIQKMASTFVQGAAMSMATLKSGNSHQEGGDDDVLFCAMVAAASNLEQEESTLVLDHANAMYRKIKGHGYKSPWTSSQVEH